MQPSISIERTVLLIRDEQLEMYKQVQAWHAKLKPLLENEAKRPAFDEDKYGRDVLNLFQSIGQKKLFSDIIEGLPKEEVSQYFSIIMEMATTNLKIKNVDGYYEIELLKRERRHEEFQLNIGNQEQQ